MFTNEHEEKYSVTTILDEGGNAPDVRVIFTEEGVHILQPTVMTEQVEDGLLIEEFEEEIFFTHQMFEDMLVAYNLPEGFFKREANG